MDNVNPNLIDPKRNEFCQRLTHVLFMLKLNNTLAGLDNFRTELCKASLLTFPVSNERHRCPFFSSYDRDPFNG